MVKKKTCDKLANPKPHHWILEPPSENRYSEGVCKNCGIKSENHDNRPDIETWTRSGHRVYPFTVNGRVPYRNNNKEDYIKELIN